MAENEDIPGADVVADENPYRAPRSAIPAVNEPAELQPKRGTSGCAILFLLAMPLLDTFGMLMAMAGPYGPILIKLGYGGFVCGAALGGFVSVKIKGQPWWSSCRWAIYGLLGFCLPTFLWFALLRQR